MFLTKYIPCATLLVSALLIPPALAQSDEGGKPLLNEDRNNSPSIKTIGDPRAIKLSIVDGIIDFANNRKRARIYLTWDLLSEPQDITEQFLRDARTQVGITKNQSQNTSNADQPCGLERVRTITISNADIGVPNRWLSKLKEEDKTCLQDALGVRDLNLITSEKDTKFREDFRKFWIGDDKVDDRIRVCRVVSQFAKPGYANRPGCGRTFIENVKVPQYYSMLRDHNIITTLLESNGIAYSLTLDGIEVSLPGDTSLIPYQDKNTYISYKDIDWKITIFRIPVNNEPNLGVSYYRFAIRAVTKPIEIQFTSKNSTVQPKIQAEISFREASRITNPDIDTVLDPDFTDIKSESVLSEDIRKKLSELQKQNANSQLNVAFQNITGVSAGQVVSRGLLGGSSNTNVIGGALIGNDQIQSLVGANLEVGRINNNLVTGLLLGVSPRENDATLFLGPSLRFSIFTLAGGARVFDIDNGVRIRPAGVISLDLTRVFGGEESTKIVLKDPNIGGGWFDLSSIVSQDVSKNVALFGYTLKPAKGVKDSNFVVKLVRQCSQEENQNEQKKKDCKLEIPLSPTDKQKLLFLPKGIYHFGIEPPEKYLLKACTDKGDKCRKVSTQDLADPKGSYVQADYVLEYAPEKQPTSKNQ